MGVFDFVKNAGAKVGIGKSTDEEEAEQKAAAAEAAADANAKAAAAEKKLAARRAARAKERENKDAAEAKQEAKKKAVVRNFEAAQRKAAHTERVTEYKKSAELERYVTSLGLEAAGIDIRFDDGTAYITGEAADQETKERIILAVGNAQGVGKVDEEMTVGDPSEEAHFHTVAPGDTLWAVATKVYGDGSKYTKIFEANTPMLKDPDLIFPGQVLRCPLDD